jgi:hypothetical protein
MFGGGDKRIEGGDKRTPEPIEKEIARPVCQSQEVDEQSVEVTESFTEVPTCSIMSRSDCVITPGQGEIFSADGARDGDVALDVPLPDSNYLFDRLIVGLGSTPPPGSAVDAVNFTPYDPAYKSMAADARSYDLRGDAPFLRAEEFKQIHAHGQVGIQYLEGFLDRSVGDLVQSSARSMENASIAADEYSEAARAIHREGTNYGFTASHAHEFYMNELHTYNRVFRTEDRFLAEVYDEVGMKGYETDEFYRRVDEKMIEYLDSAGERMSAESKYYERIKMMRMLSGDPGSRKIKLTGFNVGMNMTDINKRDPSGGRDIGDPIKDHLRSRFNEMFGKKIWGGGYDGSSPRAADNVANLKNMTNLAMDITPEVASEVMPKLYREMLDYVHTHDFGVKADLRDIKFPLAGHYEEMVVDFSKNPMDRPGRTATRVIEELLGKLHVGEDVASKKNVEGKVFIDTEPVSNEMGKRAVDDLFELFRSEATRRVGGSGNASTAREILSRINRESHSYGFGLVHSKQVRASLEKMLSAIKMCQGDATNENMTKLENTRRELLQYIRRPSMEIDPRGMHLSDRLEADYQRSRGHYRFSSDGLTIYKMEHMNEVTKELLGVGHTKAHVISLEGKHLSDFMRAYNGKSGFGPHDPLMQGLFQTAQRHYSSQGLEVVQVKAGGDEIFLTVKAIEGVAPPNKAKILAVTKGFVGEVDAEYSKMSFSMTEKRPVVGGEWGGLAFGVSGDRLVFKRPAGENKALFKKQISEVLADPEFQKIMKSNFNVRDGYGVVNEEGFNKLDSVGRRGAWDVVGKAGNKLYLAGGVEAVGATRASGTFGIQASIASISDAKDYPVIVSEVLQRGIDKLKASDGSVIYMDEPLTFAQKAKGRMLYRVAKGAGNFISADVVARLLWGEEVDHRILLNVGAMYAGGAFGDKMARASIEAAGGNLIKRTSSGYAFNRLSMKANYKGWKARGVSGVGSVAALVAMDLIDDFKIDPAALANSLAVMKGAQYITRFMRGITPLRRAKVGGPLHLFVEFMIMHGLCKAESMAILAYEKSERRQALAGAMKNYDDAVLSINNNESVSGVSTTAEVARLKFASGELTAAYRSYFEILAYHDADEFEPVKEADEEIEERQAAVATAVRRQPIPEGLPDWLKGTFIGHPAMAGGPSVYINLSKDEINGLARARESELEEVKVGRKEAIKTANKNFMSAVVECGTQKSGSHFHIPFPVEYDDYMAANGNSYVGSAAWFIKADMPPMDYKEYLPAKDRAEMEFRMRYWDALDGDSHEVTLKYLLYMEERVEYLRNIAREKGIPEDFIKPYLVSKGVDQPSQG